MSDGFIVTRRFGNSPKQSSSACIVPQVATDLNLLQVHLKNQRIDHTKLQFKYSTVAFGGIFSL